jgi:3,4-dihydroxy 2-butanone 4-phosphate synthase/GTP cyclohydrolase II
MEGTRSPTVAVTEALRNGRVVVLCDESEPEGPCHLVAAAESITPEVVNFMAREARGLVCLALDHAGCERLGLEPLGGPGSTGRGPDFMTTIDAASGVTTGISAADRAHTIRVAAAGSSGPDAVVVPGHVIPIRVAEAGLARKGHAEAAVDLARRAGCGPAAVVCAAMEDDGSMATVADMTVFCTRHDLKMVTMDLLAERSRGCDPPLEKVAESLLPTPFGEFRAIVYRSVTDGMEHVAIVKGAVEGATRVLVHVHQECFAGDVLDGLGESGAARLRGAMSLIEQAGRGVVVYLAEDRRGILAAGEAGAKPGRPSRGAAARILSALGVSGAQLIAVLN